VSHPASAPLPAAFPDLHGPFARPFALGFDTVEECADLTHPNFPERMLAPPRIAPLPFQDGPR
jgi:hypothetical protein